MVTQTFDVNSGRLSPASQPWCRIIPLAHGKNTAHDGAMVTGDGGDPWQAGEWTEGESRSWNQTACSVGAVQ